VGKIREDGENGPLKQLEDVELESTDALQFMTSNGPVQLMRQLQYLGNLTFQEGKHQVVLQSSLTNLNIENQEQVSNGSRLILQRLTSQIQCSLETN
jgi:hypothetical protein